MFPAEKDLVYAFKTVFTDFLNSNLERPESPFFLVEEFDSLCGIADLVVGTSLPLDDKDFFRKSISLNWVRPIYNMTKNQEIEIDDFIKTYCISKSTATARFKEYSEAGFLKRISKRKYRVIKEYKLFVDTIISIEAKIRDWQRALYQAVRYKRFSNMSYVLLDSKHINPAKKNIRTFMEKNIGLMSMDNKGFTIHYNPNAENAPQSHSFFRLNEAALSSFKDWEAYA